MVTYVGMWTLYTEYTVLHIQTLHSLCGETQTSCGEVTLKMCASTSFEPGCWVQMHTTACPGSGLTHTILLVSIRKTVAYSIHVRTHTGVNRCVEINSTYIRTYTRVQEQRHIRTHVYCGKYFTCEFSPLYSQNFTEHQNTINVYMTKDIKVHMYTQI